MAGSTRRTAAAKKDEMVTTAGERKGIFLRGADYLLSRLPFTKYKYQDWSKATRIVVGDRKSTRLNSSHRL